ncbi:hypothetical protein [Methanoregula sp.]
MPVTREPGLPVQGEITFLVREAIVIPVHECSAAGADDRENERLLPEYQK